MYKFLFIIEKLFYFSKYFFKKIDIFIKNFHLKKYYNHLIKNIF